MQTIFKTHQMVQERATHPAAFGPLAKSAAAILRLNTVQIFEAGLVRVATGIHSRELAV
jgi:hypothetical protein